MLYLRETSGIVTETETGDENRIGTWNEAAERIVFGNELAERAHRRHTDYRKPTPRPVKKARREEELGEKVATADTSLVTPTTCAR